MTVELINSLLQGRSGADDERRINELVASLDDAELNRLLTPETCERLLSSLDDRWFGPDERTALLEHLVNDRGLRLDVAARAALLRALQSGHTSRDDEGYCVELLCQISGSELTQLKNQLDQAKDRHNLKGLVFGAIDDDERRQRVLDHIAAQAPTGQPRQVKVLSDIDDTVFCKLHDKRYPKGIVYPGVLAFQEALDLGPDEHPQSRGDITFVTARPKDVLGLVASHSRESLNRAGVADLSILSGSLFSLTSHDAMAGKKVDNICHYAQLFPEYDLVFMGDSGQGDVMVGEQIWQKFPQTVKAVFIHDVIGTSDDERTAHAAHHIWFHDTYLAAAAKAFELGLVSSGAVAHVIDEAFEALEGIAWDDDEQRERMLACFERDRRTAEQALAQ